MTILTTSLFSIFSFLAAVFTYLVFQEKYKTIVFTISSSVLFVVFMFFWGSNKGYFHASGRLLAWQQVFIGTNEKFLFGHGLGSFPLHIAPLALFTLLGWLLVTSSEKEPLVTQN